MGATLCSADLQTQESLLPTLAASNRGAQLVCETAEGNKVAAAMGKDVDVIDGSSGKRAKQLKGHTGPVTCLTSSRGALFSGSIDRTVKRWDARRGRLLHTMEGHTGPVWCLVAIGGWIFSAGDDATIRHWDAMTGAPIGVLQEHHSQPVLCLLAAQGTLYSASEDKTLRHWDLATGKTTQTLEHSSAVTCLLSAEGSIFSGCRDATIRRWSVETGQLQASLEGAHGRRKVVQRHSACDGGGFADDAQDEDSCILCLYATSSYVFSGSRDGSIGKWDLISNELIAKMGGPDEHELGVTCFLQHGDMILSGSADGTVRLWDKDSGELCNILEGASGVTCLIVTMAGVIFGGQARGTPQRLPPLMRRRWWQKEERSAKDGRGSYAPAATEGVVSKATAKPPESTRKFL